jgi:hypothetical protein
MEASAKGWSFFDSGIDLMRFGIYACVGKEAPTTDPGEGDATLAEGLGVRLTGRNQ